MSAPQDGRRELQGTVALITGTSSGIGAETARVLSGHGAAVALVARRRDRLEELRDVIQAEGGRALVVEADLTQQEQAISAVEQTVAEFGRLDTLVNNAGVMLLGPIVDAPTEEWDRMVALNLQGLLYVSHAALPHLIRAAEDSPRRVADLVNISSTAGRFVRLGSGVYNATKFGVNAFTESLRLELSRRHVRVSVVEPGAVNTELSSHVRREVWDQASKGFEGIERLQAGDIADAVGYIVTRERRVAVHEMLVRPSEQDF